MWYDEETIAVSPVAIYPEHEQKRLLIAIFIAKTCEGHERKTEA